MVEDILFALLPSTPIAIAIVIHGIVARGK